MSDKKYPENLLKDVGINTENLPEDIEASIMYVLCGLSERQQFCILKYYRDGLTLKEISDELNVTPERIRQINDKAVRMLAAPHRRRFLEIGVKGVINESALIAKKSAIISELNEARALLDKAVSIIIPNVQYGAEIACGKPLNEVTVEELELSFRSTHCLLRSGIKTVGDLRKLSRGEFYRIRNLGRKSLAEIEEKLNSLGIEITGEMEDIS